jgi:hypothetical protein
MTMYDGHLIEELITSVEAAEQHAQVTREDRAAEMARPHAHFNYSVLFSHELAGVA